MGFAKDFLWGAASAAHQVEGAYNEDGKTLGIWDALNEGHVRHGDNGNRSDDHYHRFKEDVALMKELKLRSYRFSISWPRVIPEQGVVNEQGLQFYSDLVDELLAAGIEPLVTLFHWNLPMWMYEKGGWESEEVIEAFAEYTRVVVERLSDRVTYFMTLNEPQCFVTLGYANGVHAPFLQKPEAIKSISRIAMLAHGRSVQTIREVAKRPVKVGFAPTGSGTTPMTEDADAIEQARALTYGPYAGSFGNDWWQDTMILGEPPEALQDTISEEDLEIICQPLDFYGFNIYQSNNYGDYNEKNPLTWEGMPRTTMHWPITPECLYWMTKFHYERYHLPIMLTENGMANTDFVMLDGKVHDPQRIDYIHRYLKQLKRAADEGVEILGYQYWSIMDNFEWAEGYDQRFGLIYVDYRTGKRTIKDSGYFYREVIETNGENI